MFVDDFTDSNIQLLTSSFSVKPLHGGPYDSSDFRFVDAVLKSISAVNLVPLDLNAGLRKTYELLVMDITGRIVFRKHFFRVFATAISKKTWGLLHTHLHTNGCLCNCGLHDNVDSRRQPVVPNVALPKLSVWDFCAGLHLQNGSTTGHACNGMLSPCAIHFFTLVCKLN